MLNLSKMKTEVAFTVNSSLFFNISMTCEVGHQRFPHIQCTLDTACHGEPPCFKIDFKSPAQNLVYSLRVAMLLTLSTRISSTFNGRTLTAAFDTQVNYMANAININYMGLY